jgi:myo-inositol-1(or 4)-monophosphatase
MEALSIDCDTGTAPAALTLEIADTANQAAGIAGAIQMNAFRSRPQASEVLIRDLKTEVDEQCERAIVDLIRSRFPDHRILGEEGGLSGGQGEYIWIVDPLDGTVNFVHGLPQFCACVACCRTGRDGNGLPRNGRDLMDRAVASAVFSPATGESYLGIRGHGATFNDRPLHCADTGRLSEAIVALSFGKTEAAIDRMTVLAGQLAKMARKIRSYGCAGMDIIQVAHGRLGGLLYRGIQLWDIAAAAVVLVEAGGFLQTEQRTDGKWDLVASVPGVTRELLTAVDAHS